MTEQAAPETTQGPWELPDGWEWVRLRTQNVAEVIMGQSPPGSSYNSVGKGLPFFQGKAEFGGLYPVAKKWCTDPRRIALPGDVLMSVRAPVGPTNLADEKCCIGRGLAAIRPGTLTLSRYLLYALRAREQELSAYGKGSTFAAIGKKELSNLGVPLPYPTDPDLSLETQHRIVARIEELLAEVKEARALLAEMRRDAGRMMDATLVETLMALDTEFPESPSVGDLIADGRIKASGGGTPSKANSGYWIGSIPWVSPKDMKRWRIDDTIDHVSPAAVEETSVKLIPEGAVLVVTRGMILAHTWPVTVTNTEVTINQDMKALSPRSGLLSEYLAYVLRARAPEVLRQVEVAAHGTRRLTTKTLTTMPIPLPELEAQERIVAHLDAVQAEADRMREALDEEERLLDLMERSILERAFRGEL